MCFIASPLWAGIFPELISSSTGNTYVVSTESEFNQRAASAQPGDVILVADGTYSGWQLKIPSVGTNDKPIIYTAQHPGKVTFKNGVDLFKITGSYNVIGGFNIDNVGYEVFLIKGGASHNRITDNKMNGPGSLNSGRGFINVREQSHYNRIDHNEIIGAKDAIRIWLLQEAVDNGPSQHTRIDHNVFKDTAWRPTQGGILQIGQGCEFPESILLEVRAIFEHNTVENHFTGYSEIISSKSCYNIIRYNEIKDSYGGISLRSGNYNEVYSNYIHGSGTGRAITIKGAYHKICNNVIDAPEKTGIKMDRWGHRNYKGDNRAEIPPTHDNIIAYNTIIDYDDKAMRIGDIHGEACIPLYNCKVFNNIIIGDGGDLFHSNTDSYQSGNSRCDERDWGELGDGYNDVEISNNLFFKSGTTTYGSGYNLDANKVVGNPNLMDLFSLPSDSIAIDKGIAIPGLSVDYYGNPRDGSPDIGAVEYLKVPPPRDVRVVMN
jgi:poly(beta-D-mannuronate) lyase